MQGLGCREGRGGRRGAEVQRGVGRTGGARAGYELRGRAQERQGQVRLPQLAYLSMCDEAPVFGRGSWLCTHPPPPPPTHTLPLPPTHFRPLQTIPLPPTHNQPSHTHSTPAPHTTDPHTDPHTQCPRPPCLLFHPGGPRSGRPREYEDRGRGGGGAADALRERRRSPSPPRHAARVRRGGPGGGARVEGWVLVICQVALLICKQPGLGG